MDKIYQIFDKEFNDEKFCINARDISDAKSKMIGWIRYHNYDTNDFDVIEVISPKYVDNIHNEYVR